MGRDGGGENDFWAHGMACTTRIYAWRRMGEGNKTCWCQGGSKTSVQACHGLTKGPWQAVQGWILLIVKKKNRKRR
jgi:hypothetical protein